MIYATGDTHGDFRRFEPENFPEQAHMTRDDFMLICGDFGGVWFGGIRDDLNLNLLASLPFTVLFVSGNHENYDLLKRYPVEEWNGGKIQRIRPNVIHLMRGQVFELQGRSFFTMGGARSHDIDDGILNPGTPDFEEQYRTCQRMHARFRVNHFSWWEEELPCEAEYEEARKNLERVRYQTDYVVTHCAPSGIADILGGGEYEHDRLTDFLEDVREKAQFRSWLFGHYHDDRVLCGRFVLLWEQMVRVV